MLAIGSNSNSVKYNNFVSNTIGVYVKDSSDANYIVRNNGSDNSRIWDTN